MSRSGKVNLVTGATGLLGSHLAERLIARGEHVRALVRPSSDTTFLESLGADLVVGDLSDVDSVDRAATGVDIVYHCAAKLGDWGRWNEFDSGTVKTTRNIVLACKKHDIDRLLHVSSVAAYGHPRLGDEQLTEEQPLGQNLWLWDNYARAKMLAEQETHLLGDRVTIVRPTWIYGRGDRAILPRIINALRHGRVTLVGSGDNYLNMVHANDVAEGAILAANSQNAGGETYNLSSEGEISQREFYALLCDELNLPQVKRRAPLRLAYAFGFFCELFGRAVGRQSPPHVTRHGISLLSRPTMFSSDKARTQLNWQPRVKIAEGLPQVVGSLIHGERDVPVPSSQPELSRSTVGEA